MGICVRLVKVAGYCRVREYPGCATQEEQDVGRALGLNRSATQDECFSHMVLGMRLARNPTDPSLRRLLSRTLHYVEGVEKRAKAGF